MSRSTSPSGAANRMVSHASARALLVAAPGGSVWLMTAAIVRHSGRPALLPRSPHMVRLPLRHLHIVLLNGGVKTSCTVALPWPVWSGEVQAIASSLTRPITHAILQ